MNRSRLEPLGVPGPDYNSYGGSVEQQAGGAEPKGLDRWLVQQLMSKLDASRVRVVLWDAPQKAPSDEPVTVRVSDRKALFQLVTYPELHFGDLYSAGRITVQGSLLTVLDEAYRYVRENKTPGSWLSKGPRIAAPSLLESQRNIHHHYDIGNDFYELWLDRDALQYTCAYFASRDMTIEQAQQAKMHHVCRKLRLRRDEEVVEAGGGWGGFALFMAERYGVKVKSFNISKEQIAFSRDWAKRRGLEKRVEFVEDDFRNIAGRYDAFVSIGMLEHAGAGNYKELGALVDRVIAANGRGLVHSIGRDRADRLNPWIDKRIFPGAYPPTLREMMDIFEPNGLSVLDVENIRLHYAETLRAWLERYEENVDRVSELFDDAFVRAWRLYLAGSIMAFVRGNLQLFQVLFARSGCNDIPWTRADIYDQVD